MDSQLTLFFGIAMLAILPLVALVFRWRITVIRNVSYGTMLAGAVGAVVLNLALFSKGERFSADLWSGRFNDPLDVVLTVLGFLTAMCVLTALGFVIYYQTRNRTAPSLSVPERQIIVSPSLSAPIASHAASA
jgi:hypothetical protein